MAAVTTASPGFGSSPSDSLVITSPSLSASSLSSSGFEFVAVNQRLEQSRSGNTRPPGPESFSDDDEIVWSVSESELDFEGANAGLLSDDDFVVLGRTRSPVRNTGATGTGTGTIRGAVPRNRAAVPSAGGLSGSDGSMELPQGPANATEKMDVISADLAAELSKLNMGTEFVDEGCLGDTSGAKTPIGSEPDPFATEPSVTSKKERTEKKRKEAAEKQRREKEEILRRQARRKERRKEKAEKERKEKEAGEKRKAKEKSKHKDPTEVTTTPVPREFPLPPVSPILLTAPALAKSTSTATIVPSSSTGTAVLDPEEQVAPFISSPPLSPPSSPKTPTTATGTLKGKKKHKKDNTSAGAVPVVVHVDEEDSPFQQPDVAVEKVSEQTQEPTAYDEAASYITSYISNPTAHHDQVCHLTLLQSLIIELGLLTDLTLLPRTIRSAKKFIKKCAFLNVKEYIAKRGQGRTAVQGLLFPSRSALVKDMRKKKNFASLRWVKKTGLQDLLVTAFRR